VTVAASPTTSPTATRKSTAGGLSGSSFAGSTMPMPMPSRGTPLATAQASTIRRVTPSKMGGGSGAPTCASVTTGRSTRSVSR
jgi:hypothetical protein